MAMITYEQLKQVVASYIDANKIGVVAPFEMTTDNIAKLADKIAKIVNIDGVYEDKLSILNGEDLPFGKTIEEYFEDLVAPTDYDSTGAGALSPSDPSYRPNSYSYTLGRKKFKTTKRYNDLQRACLSAEDYANLITLITKKLWDSKFAFEYQAKREMLGTLAAKANAIQTTTTAYSATAALKVGDVRANGGVVALCVKAKDTTSISFENAIKQGFIVPMHLVTSLAEVKDEATGEAFITALKADVEKSHDMSEGYSLNGNTLGVREEGLLLIVKQGVMPVIDVQVLAGAFHQDKVAVPAEIIVVPDFGANDTDTFAMLIDARGTKLHKDYQAVREQENGDGDFINYFLHVEYTAFQSRNTFVKVYKVAA